MIRRVGILTALITAACYVGPVSAQTVPAGNLLGPADSLRVTWPTPTTSADGLDAPTGVRVKAVSLTGTVVRSWDTTPSVTTLTLTPQMIPAGAFNIAVHPFNVAGEAAASNSVGPFGKATTPRSLTGVSAGVVAGAP